MRKVKTHNNIDECANYELSRLNAQILDAIAEGKFSICNDGSLQPNARKKLEKLGYEVKSGMQKNESYYSVSWK